jgi:hypothetical protein
MGWLYDFDLRWQSHSLDVRWQQVLDGLKKDFDSRWQPHLVDSSQIYVMQKWLMDGLKKDCDLNHSVR